MSRYEPPTRSSWIDKHVRGPFERHGRGWGFLALTLLAWSLVVWLFRGVHQFFRGSVLSRIFFVWFILSAILTFAGNTFSSHVPKSVGTGMLLLLALACALWWPPIWLYRRRWEAWAFHQLEQILHLDTDAHHVKFQWLDVMPTYIRCDVPPSIGRDDLPDLEGQVRTRLGPGRYALKQINVICRMLSLPAVSELSWTFNWDLAEGALFLESISGLPKFIGHYDLPKSSGPLKIPIGVSHGGVREIDLNATAHGLIAGVTGGGKSVTICQILAECLRQGDIDIWAIDPKRVELNYLRDYGCRIVMDINDTRQLLSELIAEMYRRYECLEAENINHIDDLPSGKRPKHIMLAVDELAILTLPPKGSSGEVKERKEAINDITHKLGEIARVGRGAGVHVWCATQRPSAEVVPTDLREQLDARIACGWMDKTTSNIVLNSDTASKIDGRACGRAVVRDEKLEEVQIAFCQREDLPPLPEHFPTPEHLPKEKGA